MLDIISKFDNVEVENNSRITASDLVFCEHQQKLYTETLILFSNTLQMMQTMYDAYEGESWNKDGYISEHDDIWKTRDRIKDIKKDHINKICYHFENEYNVSIDENDIKRKYEELEITHQDIIDEIFIQLGGYSFEEKAIKELKDAMKKLTENYRGEGKVNIKNNKVVFDDLYFTRYCNIYKKYEMNYGNSSQTLFEALTHFDNGNTGAHWKFTNYYSDSRNKREEDIIFSKCELNLNKIKSMKLFKNGKVEVEFNSGELALKFAKEYCGYIEKVA